MSTRENPQSSLLTLCLEMNPHATNKDKEDLNTTSCALMGHIHISNQEDLLIYSSTRLLIQKAKIRLLEGKEEQLEGTILHLNKEEEDSKKMISMMMARMDLMDQKKGKCSWILSNSLIRSL